MHLKNPFEPARLDRLDSSRVEDAPTCQWHYHDPAGSAAIGESAMHGHREMELSPITWNPRLGIYESQEPIQLANPVLVTLTRSVVLFAAVWSLCELPLELWVSPSPLEGAASILGKLIWLSLTLWTLSGGGLAKAIFAFFCAASALSIASGLLEERQFFFWGFGFSAVECALKAAAFLLIVTPSARRASW